MASWFIIHLEMFVVSPPKKVANCWESPKTPRGASCNHVLMWQEQGAKAKLEDVTITPGADSMFLGWEDMRKPVENGQTVGDCLHILWQFQVNGSWIFWKLKQMGLKLTSHPIPSLHYKVRESKDLHFVGNHPLGSINCWVTKSNCPDASMGSN